MQNKRTKIREILKQKQEKEKKKREHGDILKLVDDKLDFVKAVSIADLSSNQKQ